MVQVTKNHGKSLKMGENRLKCPLFGLNWAIFREKQAKSGQIRAHSCEILLNLVKSWAILKEFLKKEGLL